MNFNMKLHLFGSDILNGMFLAKNWTIFHVLFLDVAVIIFIIYQNLNTFLQEHNAAEFRIRD